MSQDQFPHDNWPKDMDQPPKPRTGARLIHALKVAPGNVVVLGLSPVLHERHVLTINQALALMRELAEAVGEVSDSEAIRDLEVVMTDVCECYGVRDAD